MGTWTTSRPRAGPNSVSHLVSPKYMVCGTTTREPPGSTWKTAVAAAMPEGEHQGLAAAPPPSRPATTSCTCS